MNAIQNVSSIQEKSISFSIDWVSLTMPPSDALLFAKKDFLGAIVNTPTSKGMLGYNKKITRESGVLHLINTERIDMGEHFVFSGNALT